MSELNEKVAKATKWSVLTEIVAKLVTPITSMVLARLLTPEDFGIIATIVMIVSFAELFTDAGFQKYLIQHEFDNDDIKVKSTNVAFWSNFVSSLIIWGIIAVFSEPLAIMVGSPGLGYVIAISCISIPLASFSSIQMALYKRDLDFKTLFKVRIAGILIPLVITIPLAWCLRSFWALVIGTISKDLTNAVLLTFYSTWKPKFSYCFSTLKQMFSFSAWSMIEQISIWLTGYIDIFIVGRALSSYYLGIYRTSITTVGQIMGLITAATTPVLFSSLSRLQNNNQEFSRVFFNFQKWVGLLVIPLGVGIYCYSDLVVYLLLGEQWKDANEFVGLWGLTSCLMVVFAHYCSEVYRAKGKPKLSVLAQWLHMVVLIPVVYWSVNKGFEFLCISRSLVRLEGIFVNLGLMLYVFKISPFKMICNVYPELIASLTIFACSSLFREINGDIAYRVASALFAGIQYFLVLCFFKAERIVIISFVQKRFKKIKKSW